jgi:protein ImuB
MKRAMCIHLPDWPLQRLRLEQPDLRDKSVALFDPDAARAPQIVLYGAPERIGTSGRSPKPLIGPGMPVAEALAIDRRLQLRTYDPAGDLHALRGLCEWATRFSPLVGLEDGSAPQCLLLDVSGSGPYFGGEPRLLRLVANGLRHQRWKARIAIADTIGAAWAVARHRAASHIAPPGETEAVLRPLPVEALRLPAEAVNCLNALGILGIGQLMDLPRSSVPRRLGREVLDRLDRALGRTAEVLSSYQPPPRNRGRDRLRVRHRSARGARLCARPPDGPRP